MYADQSSYMGYGKIILQGRMFPSEGHPQSWKPRLAVGPRDDGFTVVIDLDHASESPAEYRLIELAKI